MEIKGYREVKIKKSEDNRKVGRIMVKKMKINRRIKTRINIDVKIRITVTCSSIQTTNSIQQNTDSLI